MDILAGLLHMLFIFSRGCVCLCFKLRGKACFALLNRSGSSFSASCFVERAKQQKRTLFLLCMK